MKKSLIFMALLVFLASGCAKPADNNLTLVSSNQPKDQSVSVPEGVKVENDAAGIEFADSPLQREPLPSSFSFNTVKFNINENSDGQDSIIMEVALLSDTFDYKVKTNFKDGFSYISYAGIICFTKPAFKYSYCLREKYTPALIARQLNGESNLTSRELTADEEEISRMLNEMGWVPGNALAAFMLRIEKAIELLRKKQLNNGAVITLKDDTNRIYETNTVTDVQFLNSAENIKTKGLHLAAIMTTLYNRDEKIFPFFSFENQKTDTSFISGLKDYGIDINNYIIQQ